MEITPATGWDAAWEARLQLQPGELNERLIEIWRAGSLGGMSEAEVETNVGAILGLDQAQVAAFMADLWNEYLGSLNVELAAYFASLRPRYQTAILSNSFAGARRQEQRRYQFDQLCDLIIYSHEEGMKKPERRFYELACARLGVAPAEVVFLDDIEVCVTAARALGMHAIQFRTASQAIAEIEARLRSAA